MSDNFFDQFDAPAVPGSAPAAPGNFFDQFDRPAPGPLPDRSAARGAADLGLEVVSGGIKGVKFIADAAGANNAASRTLDAADKKVKGLQSERAAAEDALVAQIMRDAEDQGMGDQALAALRAAGVAPVRMGIGALATGAPVIAASLIPGLREASWGARLAALGTVGAAQGAGVVKSAIFESVEQRAKQAGMSDAEAAALAEKAQSYSENPGLIGAGAALGAAGGATGFERAAAQVLGREAATQAAARTGIGAALRSTAAGVAKEVPFEAAQGGQEQFAANVATDRAGFETPAMRGVVGSAVLEGTLAAPGGAIGGALDYRRETAGGGLPPAPAMPPAPSPAPAPASATDPLARLAQLDVLAQTRNLTADERRERAQLVASLDEDATGAPAAATPAAPAPSTSILPSADTATASAGAAPIPTVEGDTELQNRDRGRAASIAQMQNIAARPDYLRLGPSRTPDSGAPMVFAPGDDTTAIPPAAFGREDVAVMSDGQRVPFRYAVVDAALLQPSNFADGTTNPAFNQRARGTLIALNNGRSAGLREAWNRGTADAYKAEMVADAANHGVDLAAIASVRNPVLVRVYSEQSNTANMGARSQGQGLGMSPAELARQDAQLIDGSVLAVWQGGDVSAAANRDFARAFVGKLVGAGQDVAGMVTNNGELSPAGRTRIQAAMAQAAYGDADLIGEMFDSTDTDIKTIGEALKVAAGTWANMRDSARTGVIVPTADITPALLGAVNLIRRARQERKSLFDLTRQTDITTGQTPDPQVLQALRLFYGGEFYSRPLGRDRVAGLLEEYARLAAGATQDGGLFGTTPTPADVLAAVTNKVEQDGQVTQPAAQPVGTGTSISQPDGNGDPRGASGAGGAAGPRPGDGQGGAQAAAGGRGQLDQPGAAGQATAPVAAQPAQPGYDARRADRRQRIAQAKTKDEAQAVLQEEYQDTERHFEGTSGLESAVRTRVRELDGEAAARQREADARKRLDAGEWVEDDNLSYLYRQTLLRGSDQANAENRKRFDDAMAAARAANPDREYEAATDRGMSQDMDREVVRFRKKDGPDGAGAVAPSAPLLTTQTTDELQAKAEREAAAQKAQEDEQRRLADKGRADAQRDGFTLTGSDRPADAAGQNDIFGNSPAPAQDGDGLDEMFADVLNEELGKGSPPAPAPAPAPSPAPAPAPADDAGQAWWTSMTPAGRRQALQQVGAKSLPDGVLWPYIPEPTREKLRAVIGTAQDPVMDARAPAASTERPINLRRGKSSASTPVARPAPKPAGAPSMAARWEVFMPAERIDMLLKAGYTDQEQSRALARTPWTDLTDPVRRALDGVHRQQLSVSDTRTAGQAAASAAQNVGQGLTNAIDGLGALFGGKSPGRLGSGPTFDEETYAKAKPLFQAALANFQDAASDIKEAMRAIVRMVLDKFGEDAARNMQPYVVRFIRDVRDGVVALAGARSAAQDTPAAAADVAAGTAQNASPSPQEPVNADPLQTQQLPAGSAPQDRGDAAAGDRDRQPVDAGMAQAGEGAADGGRVPAGAQGAGGAGTSGAGGRDGQASGAPRDRAGVGAEPGAAGDFDLDGQDIGTGGLTRKYRDNIAAIKIIKALEAEGRPSTADERRALARYVGWGALKGVFDPANKQWTKQHAELRALLTDREWDAAKASTLNAHYTSPVVVKAMYSVLERLGATRGRVLEPSVGSGNFFGLMPKSMRATAQLFGVELDPITSRIAAGLYPSAKVRNQGFEDFDVPGGFFDIAIGNPPFGNEPLADMHSSPYSGWSIHNYFFAKTIDKLRPGGVMVMVVSHNFLDAADGKARRWIADRASLVGAVRLPRTAFMENAGTEVVTDIIVFQKHDRNGLPRDERAWLDLGEQRNANPKTGDVVAHRVNRYFLDNPGSVLGTPGAGGTMYRPNEYTVEPVGNLEDRLARWAQTLPENIFVPIDRTEKMRADEVPEGVKVGSFFVAGDGSVKIRAQDEAGERRATAWTAPNEKAALRVKGMIRLRNALRAQMRLERSPQASEQQIEAHRRDLNRFYDEFQKDYGYVNDPTNRRLFLDDTEASLLLALEFDYDRGMSEAAAAREGVEPRKPSAKKADIFKRRVLFPPQDGMVVASARDAMLASLNFRGTLDMAYMSRLYGKGEAEIVAELGDLVFAEPGGKIVTADEYLSGDVKTKLAQAEVAARGDAGLRRNVEALRKVIPEDKRPSEIHAAIGAKFIAGGVLEQFAKIISGADVRAHYVPSLGRWLVAVTGNADATLNRGKWGTTRMPALEILDATIAGKSVVVTDTHRNGDGSTTTTVNEKETEAARDKQRAIQQEWQTWLWSDPDRAARIAADYNEQMNRWVDRRYDGSHLTLPGKVPDEVIGLLPHQKNGVWRALQSRQILLDHVVGAGKTFQMVSIAMELRRTGVARKPLFAVPNHLTLQWFSEFARLYPGANVLAATPDDFAKGNREKFFSKIITGDWDAVIVGHSSLKKIALPPETERAVLEEQVREISDAIEQMKRARGDSRIVGDMERIKRTLEAKMKTKLAALGSRDKVVTFDELGVDAFFVDELHEFKNLFYTSTMDRVPGMGNPNGSDKAFDLFVKLQWMFNTLGKQAPIVGATGTPVSNSLVEMFNMQRFMQYPLLKEEGLHVFDAWARQFGSVENVYEVSPSGTGYRSSTRFSKFKNLGALMAHYNAFADVVTLDDLKSQEEARGSKFPVPRIRGGRPTVVVADRSPQVASFMGVPQLELDINNRPVFGFMVADGDKVKFEQKDGKTRVLVESQVQGQAPVTRLLGAFETDGEARMAAVEAALSPRIFVDPRSILGQFQNLRQLTKDTKGKINALSLTGAANKAGLDYRLVDPAAPDFAGSKINLAIDNMMDEYRRWADDKGAQLIFCDLSVPLSERGSLASAARRLYVREDGQVVHKRGTMHTVEGYEALPFFVVQSGSGDAKTQAVYDAASGTLLRSGFKSKGEALVWAADAARNEDKRQRWIDERERVGEITQELIDDYDNANEIDATESPYIAPQDIAGVSATAKFSVYDDIRAKLMARGVPEAEIAFIHDYATPAAKDKLFKAVRRGDVRFLLGSTPKMGAGTNVQDRLVALHHIDAPWRPSDLEQREGRIIRRGNELYQRDPEGFEVGIYRYATKQTYDTRRWQILEHKARGIEQLRNYDGTANEIEDIDGEAANAAEMKAAASGDPLILRETQLRNEVKRLENLQAAHADAVADAARRARWAREYVEIAGPAELAGWKRLIGAAAKHPVPEEGLPSGVTIGGQVFTDRKEFTQAIARAVAETASAGSPKTTDVTFRGLRFRMDGSSADGVRLADVNDSIDRTMGYWPAKEPISATGIIQRMANFVERMDAHRADIEQGIERERQNEQKWIAQSRKAFAQAQELADVRLQHTQVQRLLLARGPEIPEAQKPLLAKAQERQRRALRAAGLGDALDEIMAFAQAPGDAAPPTLDEGRGTPAGTGSLAQTGAVEANEADVLFDIRRNNPTRAQVRAARAALERIRAADAIRSSDDLAALLRVSGFSQWSRSAVMRDVDAAARLRQRLTERFPGDQFGDWRAPRLNEQGVITTSAFGLLSDRDLSDLAALADEFGAPVALRGALAGDVRTENDRFTTRLKPLGFAVYTGAQELDNRPPGVLFSYIRPGGGIGRNTPLWDISAGARSPASAQEAAAAVAGPAFAGYERKSVPRVQAGQRLGRLVDRLDQGALTEEGFVTAARVLADDLERAAGAKRRNRDFAERERGSDWVREKLIAARRRGDLDADTAEFALWALGRNEALAADLGISVRQPRDDSDAGQYNPAERVMTLFKGATNPGTAVHEILHHAERMMTPQQQARIRFEWARSLARAVKRATPAQREALALIGPAMAGDQRARQALVKAFADGVLDYDAHYQLVNPSEFWAVNATDLLQRRFDARGSVWQGIWTWLREMAQRAAGILGVNASAEILRGLDEVLGSANDGAFRSRRMLTDMGAQAGLADPAGAGRGRGGEVRRGSAEQAVAAGYTMRAWRGVSAAAPFNDSGSTWLTTSREVAEAYAEEVMGYDDPAVIEVMIKPDDLPRHDASRLTDEERAGLQADEFGNPQAIGIYDRSDDHPLGGSRRNVTVIHAPKSAVWLVDESAAPSRTVADLRRPEEAEPEDGDIDGALRREFQQTERAYGGRNAYGRAKAAGKTKLTYGQWVQVRTPRFKAWFGDWEAVRAQGRLDAMEPVEVRVPQEWRALSGAELRAKMAQELDRMVRERTKILHPDLGQIQVGRVGAKKSVGSARDPAKAFVAADIEALIPASIYARSEPSRSGSEPDIDGYSTLLARVAIDGVPLVAAFTVRHQSDGRWYYNAVTLHDAKEEARNSYGRPDQASENADSSVAPIAGLAEFSRRPLRRVNPDAVSKAVDPDTGEPLVVYHGTHRDFSAFDAKAPSTHIPLPGFYFTPDAEIASAFAENGARMAENRAGRAFQPVGASVMPAYLSMKNPLKVNASEGAMKGFVSEKVIKEVILDARRKGHDGVILRGWKDGSGPVQYIAFEPEQIKSAIGNRGTFDPADNGILRDIRRPPRNSIGPNPPPQPAPAQRNRWQALKQRVMNLTSPEALDKLIYELQDRFVDLKRVQAHIQALGGTVNDLNDAYMGEELFHKRLATRTERFLDDELSPLLKDMRERGIGIEQFEEFLHARHAPEANAAMAARNPSRAELDALQTQAEQELRDLQVQRQRAAAQGTATAALDDAVAQARERLAEVNRMQAYPGTEEERLSLSGMSDADAAAVMARLSPAQRADMDALAARVDAINAKTLETLEQYGLVPRAMLDTWRAAYRHYVPLHRDEAHPDSHAHPIGQGFNVRGMGMRQRVGSTQKVTNILGHIAMQREAALTRGEKNLVLQKLYVLVGQNPLRGFWRIDSPPMTKTVDPVTGTVRRQIDGVYRNLPNVVTLRIAGKDASIIFEEGDPQAMRLATAMKGADVGDLGFVSSVVSKYTRWFAAVNTQYNPIFGVVNMLRDVQGAALNLSTTPIAGQERRVLAGVLPALRAVWRKERGSRAANPVNAQWIALWKDLEQVGGATGFRDLFADINDRAKEMQKELAALDRGWLARGFVWFGKLLSDYNEALENAVRVSAYKAALDSGITKERAASLAKNLTVNFNRKGRAGRHISAWYAFFNSSVQGTTRMVETLRGPKGRAIMVGGVLVGVLNTTLGMLMMGGGGDDGEEDNWDKIPEWVKERNLIIPLSNKDYVTIPMPLGFHFLPNLGRLATEWVVGGSEKSAGKQVAGMLQILLDAFNPLGGAQPIGQMAMPTVVDPFWALATNTDWNGRPIYREDSSPLDPQPGMALAKDAATPWGKVIAESVNVATGGTKYQPGAFSPTPDQIDYIIGQLTGGVGREIGKLATTVSAPIAGDELPIYKVPLLGRFAGSVRGSAGQADTFYENVKEINQIENELRGRAKAGEDVAEVQREEPLAALAGAGNAYTRKVSELRRLRREVAAAEAPGYREQLAQIDEQITAVMTDLNRRVTEVRRTADAAQ